MKKLLSLILVLSISLLMLLSCGKAEDYYEDYAILVSVKHISGFEVVEEYDLYLDDIIPGEKYELPMGDANTYRVEATVAGVDREKITITFSQPMDGIDTDTSEVTSFELRQGMSEGFVTPTCGGGDSFTFSIVHKSEVPGAQG